MAVAGLLQVGRCGCGLRTAEQFTNFRTALGSLEASVARNMAWARYQEASEQVQDNVDLAVMAAQEIEYESIDTANLSVQVGPSMSSRLM